MVEKTRSKGHGPWLWFNLKGYHGSNQPCGFHLKLPEKLDSVRAPEERNLSLLRPRLSSASFIRFIYRKVLPANRRIRPTLCLEGQDGGPCGLVRNEILDDS